MSVSVPVSVYQKAAFVLHTTSILLKEITIYHREKKIAYLFLKNGFLLI